MTQNGQKLRIFRKFLDPIASNILSCSNLTQMLGLTQYNTIGCHTYREITIFGDLSHFGGKIPGMKEKWTLSTICIRIYILELVSL